MDWKTYTCDIQWLHDKKRCAPLSSHVWMDKVLRCRSHESIDTPYATGGTDQVAPLHKAQGLFSSFLKLGVMIFEELVHLFCPASVLSIFLPDAVCGPPWLGTVVFSLTCETMVQTTDYNWLNPSSHKSTELSLVLTTIPWRCRVAASDEQG